MGMGLFFSITGFLIVRFLAEGMFVAAFVTRLCPTAVVSIWSPCWAC